MPETDGRSDHDVEDEWPFCGTVSDRDEAVAVSANGSPMSAERTRSVMAAPLTPSPIGWLELWRRLFGLCAGLVATAQ